MLLKPDQIWAFAISLTTNGVLFTPSVQENILKKLHSVKFSAIDNNPERYSMQHGCKPDQCISLLDNIKNAIKIRNEQNLKVALIASIYLDKNNIKDACNIILFFKEIGLDYLVISEAVFTASSPEREEKLISQI